MTTIPLLDPILAAELTELNEDQRDAVLESGDVVVRAGPGSGKTRTLVAKAGYLLQAQIPARRGVAAITYTRHAAGEIAARLEGLGIRPGHRLTASTLHGWCLNAVLRPFAPLVGMPLPDVVIHDTSDEWTSLLQHCLDDAGVMANAEWERASITKIRRHLAAGIEVDPSDPFVRAARLFDERMLERDWFDFDLMTSQALKLLQQHPQVAHLVAARYPWVMVDEYQDLGPVLHALVLYLHDEAAVKVAAFGDADQSVMEFTGADPRYLNELAGRRGFRSIPLRINYRCGEAIIAASMAALNEHRPYRAHPDRVDPGDLQLVPIKGGLEDHAAATISVIDKAVARGVPPHRIAIFYTNKKCPLLAELVTALEESAHDFVHERDERLPDGDLADFIRACAARAVAGPPLAGTSDSTHVSLSALAREYAQLRLDSELPDLPGYTAERRLAEILNDADADELADEPLWPWLSRLADTLDLEAIATASRDQRDQEALGGFREADERFALTVADIAAGALRIGKVTLTTYHSAKGREWDVVIMPGLIDGIMPRRTWDRRLRRFAEPAQLAQDRRAFYVGVTRAKNAVVLIYGQYWVNDWGMPNHLGTSRFVRDIIRSLGDQIPTG